MQQMSKISTNVSLICLLGLFLLFVAVPSIANTRNYFEILGITSNASDDEIKSAYRKLSMKYHPDRLVHLTPEELKLAEAKMKDINIAYNILSDPNKKMNYTNSTDSEQFQSRHMSEQIENTLHQLENSRNLSADSVNFILKNLAEFLPSLIESDDKQMFQRYIKAMKATSHHNSGASVGILKTLMLMETIQDFTFGLNVSLDYYQGDFPTEMISKTASEILLKIRIDSPQDAKELLQSLMEYSSVLVTFDAGVRLTNFPKWNLNMAGALYEFAVQNKLINSPQSLLSFANDYAKHLLDNRQREEPIKAFIRSQFNYTLSLLKEASANEIFTIIKNLHGVQQGIAYEEWIRNGSRDHVTASDVLKILKESRGYADHWLTNNFGKNYSQNGQEILSRIKTINKTFVPEFSRLNPTQEEVKEFIKLSGFSWGEYTMARVKPGRKSEADYRVKHSFEPRPQLDSNNFEITTVRGGDFKQIGNSATISCKMFYSR